VTRRPGIAAALEALRRRQADVRVVSRLDRLSRSMLDFAGLMDRATREGWALVALDLGVDTTTPSGEAMANVMAKFAQFERRVIAERTRDALAQRRKADVRLGRPRRLSDDVLRTIVAARGSGRTLPRSSVNDRAATLDLRVQGSSSLLARQRSDRRSIRFSALLDLPPTAASSVASRPSGGASGSRSMPVD
jgi:DNA invertase Pin-like site-specific DNA recombinase